MAVISGTERTRSAHSDIIKENASETNHVSQHEFRRRITLILTSTVLASAAVVGGLFSANRSGEGQEGQPQPNQVAVPVPGYETPTPEGTPDLNVTPDLSRHSDKETPEAVSHPEPQIQPANLITPDQDLINDGNQPQ